jgi:isopenicillin N synthase-like dioxygenase
MNMQPMQPPVVDVGSFGQGPAGNAAAVRDLRRALEGTGFVYVRGLPIAAPMVSGAFAAMRRFFAQPAEAKRRFAYAGVEANFGYQGLEVESLDPLAPPDLKEAFTMRNPLGVESSAAWPDASFRETAQGFYKASMVAAYRMLEILGACLEVPPNFFGSRHTGQNITLRFLHYPANLEPRAMQQGAGAHTDYGSITLVFQQDVDGLEVCGPDGLWHRAPPVPDCVLVNTGDLMQRWTNDRFRSTLHRVLPISGPRDRYAIALFVDPDTAVNVECLDSCVARDHPARYAPITAGEHIRRKIAATHMPA